MKYLKQTIVNPETNVSTEANKALELLVNLNTGVAIVKEGCWLDGQAIADGKDTATKKPIMWVEPDITALVTASDYPTGASLFDIVFDVIAGRMITLDNLPDGSGENPFKGGTIEDIPPAS